VLVGSIEKLTANTKEVLGRDPYKAPEMDRQIAQAEKLAEKMLGKLAEKNGPRVSH